MIKNFLRNEDGATAIEYGLITAIVAVGIILALGNLRDALNNIFAAISAALQTG